MIQNYLGVIENIKVKKGTITAAVEDYTAKYYDVLMKLYELGYAESPVLVDRQELNDILLNDYQDEVKAAMSPLTGRYELELPALEYCRLVSRDSEFKEFVGLYMDYVRHMSALQKMETLLSKCKFRRDGVIRQNMVFLACGGIVDRTAHPCPLELLGYKATQSIMSFGWCLLKEALAEAGVGKLQETETYLLQGALPYFEQERAYYMLSGKMQLTGEYGRMMVARLEEYYSKQGVKPYEQYIFDKALPAIESRLAAVDGTQTALGYSLRYMDSTRAYYYR